MKIARIETFRYWAKWKNWLFVRVETDDGLHGWGEASLAGAIGAVEEAIRELGSVLIGREAGGVEPVTPEGRRAGGVVGVGAWAMSRDAVAAASVIE